MTSQPKLLLSIHPFGFGSVSGGTQILRTLYEKAPMKVQVVNTSLGPQSVANEEIAVPPRPYFGRIERTRFSGLCSIFDKPFEAKFFKKLSEQIMLLKPSLIHSVVQDVGFWPSFECSRKLQIPYVLSVHDDVRYSYNPKLESDKEIMLDRLGTVWRDAEVRFVISKQMGVEYCARYGERPFQITTDGFTDSFAVRQPLITNRLKIYFMGLFHISYSQNLDCLIEAVERVASEYPSVEVSLVFRCGVLPSTVSRRRSVQVLPMIKGGNLVQECAEADLLYLPLPFGEDFADFVKLSLSTKLISYIASGAPILFHGPQVSAAGELLSEDAAFQVNSNRVEEMVAAVAQVLSNKAKLNQRRREHLQKDFDANEIRQRFWTSVVEAEFGTIKQ